MTTIKENPFQRSNPFAIHHQQTSFKTYQPVQNYYRPNINGTNAQYTYQPFQQNKYYFKSKHENQNWKFREDNCNKHRSFAEKQKILYETQKSAFQRQLTISRIRNRNQNRDEFKNQKIQNPFYRKNLVIGKMAESYVYIPEASYQPKQTHVHSYKSQLQISSPQNYQLVNSRYSKYPPNQQVSSVYNLNSQNHIDNISSPQQQHSLKIIQDIYGRNSQHSYQERDHSLKYGRNQQERRDSRQRLSKHSIVKFDDKSEQNSKYSSNQRETPITILTKKLITQNAPETIKIKNKTFYLNPVQVY